jgi:asparagine synthase (glutamine-hydrolysing)
MCGIAGIVGPGRAAMSAVRVMAAIQAHRGPDGEGFWSDITGQCALGHRRLAILDLSEGGHQPMVDSERGLAITYNGEIYNYLELRERLRGLGHEFRSESDTEVLLRAYTQWGVDCLQHLNGMFAFALWDGRRRTLFCARDRFGEKPLYLARAGRAFAFASEVKALALLEGVDLEVDDGVLAAVVDDGTTRTDAAQRTLLRGIRQLLPGRALEVEIRDDRAEIVREWCYWTVDLRGREAYGSVELASAARQLQDLLADSVRLRLRSDVPVGSCLSGGLDSSAVVSLMRRLEPDAELRTFTGRFPGDPLDEGRYAQLVVDASRTLASEVEPSAERFVREAARLYWHADFPIGGMSQFAQWCVFHLASERGVIVLLDGQGSDELLGGYGNAIVEAFLDQLRASGLPRAWMHERAAAARSVPARFSWPRLALTSRPAAPIRSLLRRVGGRGLLERADLFRSDWLTSARGQRPELDAVEGTEDRHALSRVLWMLSFRTMLSSLLRFGDRLSMAHSREVRLPFCDHRIAELVFRLPPELLVGDGEVKRVLRAAIDGLVPDEIVTRPKQGFIPPQDRWLVGPLQGWVRELTSGSGPLDDRMNTAALRRLADGDDSFRSREVQTLWDMTNLLAWGRFSLDRMRGLERLPVEEAQPVQPSTGVV